MVAKTESQKATAMLMPYEALWGDFLDAHSQFYVLDTEKTHLAAPLGARRLHRVK